MMRRDHLMCAAAGGEIAAHTLAPNLIDSVLVCTCASTSGDIHLPMTKLMFLVMSQLALLFGHRNRLRHLANLRSHSHS